MIYTRCCVVCLSERGAALVHELSVMVSSDSFGNHGVLVTVPICEKHRSSMAMIIQPQHANEARWIGPPQKPEERKVAKVRKRKSWLVRTMKRRSA